MIEFLPETEIADIDSLITRTILEYVAFKEGTLTSKNYGKS